ncbi:hypothetical protein GP2_003_01290 [Gordonia paraffinivorans NBRC 108238]|uniref:DUF4190 domain-containing protein n=1 Tax=Gordonia paraffinivorans NBRC 108238 TaxID=1223543 RepID=A0ABQ0IGE4_9ACTN|nr:hypothetical protein GP2_003_01290 [Gordonia paraffinivorans NBRC 108238]
MSNPPGDGESHEPTSAPQSPPESASGQSSPAEAGDAARPAPMTSTPGAGPEGTEVAESHSPADATTRIIKTGPTVGGSGEASPEPFGAAGEPPAPGGPAPSGYDSTRVISTRPPAGPGGAPQSQGQPPQGAPGYGAPQGYGAPGAGPQGYGAAGHGHAGAPGPDASGQAGSPQGPGQFGQGGPGSAQHGYGQPYPAGVQPAPPVDPAGFGDPYAGASAPKTNSLAIFALVASLLGLFCGVGGLAGLIMGIFARRQIDASNGRETGGGLALAAIIIGAIVVVWALFWLVMIGTGAVDVDFSSS